MIVQKPKAYHLGELEPAFHIQHFIVIEEKKCLTQIRVSNKKSWKVM